METKRTRRTPVGGARDILTVRDKDPNYSYRWVADLPGRIDRMKDAGYEVVTDKLEIGQKTVDRESKVGSVITKTGGGGMTLVLMRTQKEWYDEDQKSKQDRVDALEVAMKADVQQGRIPGSNQPGVGGALNIQRGK